MARKNKPGAGRPKLVLDERQIRELASIQCTMGEIAAVMGCSVDTLDRNYAEIISRGRDEGKMSLRRAQWNKAVKDGNPAMLIWLGKFYLGQKEEINFTSSEPDVRALLEKWEVVAKRKSDFSKLEQSHHKEAMAT